MNYDDRQGRFFAAIFTGTAALFAVFFLSVLAGEGAAVSRAEAAGEWGSVEAVLTQLRRDLPMLVLSALCILLGLVGCVGLTYLRMADDPVRYLSLFAVMMGLWKLADLRSMVFLVPRYAAAAGEIRAGALLMMGLCLLNHFRELFVPRRRSVMGLICICGALVCLAMLAMQVLGIAELGQNPAIGYGMLLASSMTLPLVAAFHRITHGDWGLIKPWKLLLLLPAGILADPVLDCSGGGEPMISFSVAGFVVYALIAFVSSLRDAAQKAWLDSHTGLGNHNRWNEVMNLRAPEGEQYAILVADLNGLKRVNDTMGHEAGDRLIVALAEILRGSLPRNSVICRWGGDEFAALLPGMNRGELEKYLDMLSDHRAQYNRKHPELTIGFAVGAAVSSEHPGLSRSQLFRLADEDMYRNKQLWYAEEREQGRVP